MVDTAVSQFGCRRCGKLRSFFSCAIAPKTFLRELPLTLHERLCSLWQTLMCRMRIPRRKATPYNATCGGLVPAGSSHCINGWTRVGSCGRDLTSPYDDADRTTITDSRFVVSPSSLVGYIRIDIFGLCSIIRRLRFDDTRRRCGLGLAFAK